METAHSHSQRSWELQEVVRHPTRALLPRPTPHAPIPTMPVPLGSARLGFEDREQAVEDRTAAQGTPQTTPACCYHCGQMSWCLGSLGCGPLGRQCCMWASLGGPGTAPGGVLAILFPPRTLTLTCWNPLDGREPTRKPTPIPARSLGGLPPPHPQREGGPL